MKSYVNKMYDCSLEVSGEMCKFILNDHTRENQQIYSCSDTTSNIENVKIYTDVKGDLHIDVEYEKTCKPFVPLVNTKNIIEDMSMIHKSLVDNYTIHNDDGKIILGLHNKGQGERYLSYSIGIDKNAKGQMWTLSTKLIHYIPREHYYIEIYEHCSVQTGNVLFITVGKTYYAKQLTTTYSHTNYSKFPY